MLADSRLDSRQDSQIGAWSPSGLGGDSRWFGLSDDERWRRQLGASRRWAVWGLLLGGSLGMLLFAPAQWLAQAVHSATNGHLLLAEARGSVWDGSAVPVFTGGVGSRDAAAPPGRLHWAIRPDWRGLGIALRQPCCVRDQLKLHWQPGWGSHTMRVLGSGMGGKPVGDAGPVGAANTDLGQWPTAWLSGLGTPWNTLQLQGQLHVTSPGLTLQSNAGRLRIDGTLTLEMRDLSSRLSPLPVLGSYRLQLKGLGEAAGGSDLLLDTLAGPLRLTGQGQWQGATMRFRGSAEAGEGHETALANLLNIIGRRQGALSVISIG